MPLRVAVAASGGRDSTALLHATQRAARAFGVEVHALHVHHGLRPDADAWQAQVQTQCRRWQIVFHFRRLQGRPAPGESVEAWARRERRQALQAMARGAGCELLLLAQHRRDQAETWFLQALRGGGAAGLASMPGQSLREGIVWARPWIAQPRKAIDAYIKRHRLVHVEDDSNADPRFARNRLRLQIWPALLQSFPDAESTLAAAAGQAAHAAALAAECAQQDLPGLLLADALQVTPWLALPPARRRNALAHWLASRLRTGVPASLLERLMDELTTRRTARWPTAAGELQLYRGGLRMAAASAVAGIDPKPLWIDLSLADETPLPNWRGRFRSAVAAHAGAPLSLLQRLEARPRRGGERFKLAPRALARSLKLQYQACGIPAWQRSGPLLYTADGQLVFVPGLGIDADLWAKPAQAQRQLCWVPDAAR